MSEQNELSHRIHQNTVILDTLWNRMKYLGRTDYTVEWEDNTPVVYWHGQRLGSAASLNEGSMERLADTLDKARKAGREGEQQ